MVQHSRVRGRGASVLLRGFQVAGVKGWQGEPVANRVALTLFAVNTYIPNCCQAPEPPSGGNKMRVDR